MTKCVVLFFSLGARTAGFRTTAYEGRYYTLLEALLQSAWTSLKAHVRGPRSRHHKII